MKYFWPFLLFLLTSGPAFAGHLSEFQTLLTTEDLLEPPKERVKLWTRKDLYLTIAKRGLPIKLSQQDLLIAQQNYQLTYDSYELPQPTLSGTYLYQQTSLSDPPSYAKNTTLGLSIMSNTGWGLSYGFDLPKITSVLNPVAGYSTEADTFALDFTATLNLLKGAFPFIGRAIKSEADVGLSIAQETLRGTILQTLLDAELAFYDLIVKQVRVRVLEIALQSSKALMNDVKQMVAVGEADKLTVIKSELQLAQTETDLSGAQADLIAARQTLQQLAALSDEDFKSVYPAPGDTKSIPDIPPLILQSAIDKAGRRRPDMNIARLQKQKAELDSTLAFSGELPQLDLIGAFGYQGAQSDIGSSAAAATQFKSPVYSVGINFIYHFTNDADKTAYRTSKINIIKSQLIVDQTRFQMVKEVTSTLKSVELGQIRLKTSALARNLAEKRLAAEFEKFKVGESNVRNIIDYQSDLNNARITEVSARMDLMKNLALYRTALGELPEGIALAVNHD